VSNHQAIATVTEAIRSLLDAAVSADVNGASASSVRPDTANAAQLANPGVNVFLYHVTTNAAMRNLDLPSRDRSGTTVQRPSLALNLHYLLTFHGSDQAMEPQLCMGSALRTIHDRPCLSRELVQNLVDALVAGDPDSPLAGSDLAKQLEIVRLTQEYPSVDDATKIWSVFFQTPYVLSAYVCASVALLESQTSPRATLPVREARVGVAPILRPNVRSVVPPAVDYGAAMSVTVVGEELIGDSASAIVGGEPATVGATATPRSVPLAIDPAVRLGVASIVLQTASPLDPPHVVFRSSPAFVGIRPTVVDFDFQNGGDPRFVVELPRTVEPDQSVFLILNEFDDPVPAAPRSFRIPARRIEAAATTVAFDAADVPAATYLVRVEVDRVESALAVDEVEASPTFGRYIGPTGVRP